MKRDPLTSQERIFGRDDGWGQNVTNKLFWEDPYQTHLTTTVSEVAGDLVMLESTIFFAQSGGQESDAGTIAGLPVLTARKEGLEISYQLPPDHRLQVGQLVEVEIDWLRRYCLMRLHFAAEIVLELVYRKFPGIEKIGAHIGSEKARIDFVAEENFNTHIPELESDANELIQRDLTIISEFSDEGSERRYWQIEGFSKVPCGGTHMRSTAEVGEIRLNRRNPGKGKERIEVRLV